MIYDPNPSAGYVFRSGSWTQKSSSCCDQGLEYHLLHIHTCQGLEQTTEPTSSSLCWEPQHEIWMVVDLKSWIFPMKSEHMTHIVDIVAHRVGSQLAREDHVIHLPISCWFQKLKNTQKGTPPSPGGVPFWQFSFIIPSQQENYYYTFLYVSFSRLSS